MASAILNTLTRRYYQSPLYTMLSTVDDMETLDTTDVVEQPYMAIPVPEDEMEAVIRKWCADNHKVFVPFDTYNSMTKIYIMIQNNEKPIILTNDIECLYMAAITNDTKYYLEGIEMNGKYCFQNYILNPKCSESKKIELLKKFIKLYPDMYDHVCDYVRLNVFNENKNSCAEAYELLQNGVKAKHPQSCYQYFIVCINMFWEYVRAMKDCLDALDEDCKGCMIFVYLGLVPVVYHSYDHTVFKFLEIMWDLYCDMKTHYKMYHALQTEFIQAGKISADELIDMNDEDKLMYIKLPKRIEKLAKLPY